MPLKHRVLNTGILQTNTVFNELIPYFVGAGTVQAGPGNTVSVPLGVVAGDLLLVFSISGGAMATPPGWTAVATTTPGTLVWRKFAEASETAAPFITAGTTSTVMLAYRNVLGVDNFTQFSGVIPLLSSSVTTSKTNNIVIQAFGLASSTATAVADPATTTRVNFSSTGSFGGFCISDEVQTYSGPSQRRSTTGGPVTTFNTVLVLNTNPAPKIPVRFTANNIQGQLDEVSSYQGSLNFNGTTGYLSVANTASLNMGTSSFTLEAWIYLRSTPNNLDANMGAIILDKDGQDGVSWPQYALMVNNSRQVCVSLSSVPTVTPTPTTFITGSTTLALNTWHHVAFTRVGTAGTLYVNGLSDGSTSSIPSTLNGATRSLLIGYSLRSVFTASYLFPGNISNLRVVKGTALYTANFAPPRTRLLPVTNTALLLNTATSRPFFDSSGNNNIITVNGGVTSNTLTPLIVGPKLQLSQLSNTGIIYVAGQFDEVNSLFYSDGSSLTGWTNAGITIDSVVGNPINSFKSTGSSQYAYINPASITSFVGKTIQVDMRSTGGTPLVGFFFGCNISGAGQQVRLESRIGFGTGFANTSNWTTWDAPAGSTSLTANTWHTFKIQINSTATNGMSLYINGSLFGTRTFINNGGYIGLQGDAGSGGNWDNIYIFDGIV